MVKLLIISDADSIFMVEYAKALKNYMDIDISLYQAFPDRGWYKEFPYDHVYFDNCTNKWYCNIKFLSRYLKPYIYRYRLKNWLKTNNIHYDIIHIQRVLPSWILGNDFYHNYCKKLFLTFWGGEFDGFRLLHSNNLYINKTRKFLNSVDVVVNALADNRYIDNFPVIAKKWVFGIFGSSIIDRLSDLSNKTKSEVKETLGIPKDKITVMLGYSGKAIHRHIQIIEGIENDLGFNKIKDRVHFIAHMSRGGDVAYNKLVENELQRAGCTYTIITNYCSDEVVAQIRYATDIFFQLTTFDGLSTSIKEYLCAGAIMISGDWYPAYHILKEDGFIYEEVPSLEKGIEKFYEVIENLQTYQDRIKNNVSIAFEKYSWSSTIVNWAEAYKKALSI